MSEELPQQKKLTQIVVTLEFPFKFGDREITELVMKRPTAGDIANLDAETMKAGDLIKIGLKCAGEPATLMKHLDASDGIRLAEEVGNFL